MPTATHLTPSEDDIDDLLYLARIGETSDLAASIDALAKTLSIPPSTVVIAAVDPQNGNSLLHMASANGHTETLRYLFSLPLPLPHTLNLPNSSGNTSLHWAALNGHLEAVKTLIGAGADVTVINEAGHDPVYAAEVNEKTEVAEWLLRAGKGLETGVSGSEEGTGEAHTDTDAEGGENVEEVRGGDAGLGKEEMGS